MKNYKKIITLTLTIFLLLSNLQLPLAFAIEENEITEKSTTQETGSVDTTPPTLDMNSLKIDKKDAKPGDNINISLKANDNDSAITQITITYKHPQTPKLKTFLLTYDQLNNTYIGSLKIDDSMENGTWNIYDITLYYNSVNTTSISAEDYNLSTLNFNVFENDNVDITPPIVDMNSLKIDKTNAVPGDSINISIKASDDKSGIKFFEMWYTSPTNSKTKYIKLNYDSLTDSYLGSFQIDTYMESGTWTVYGMGLEDNNDNHASMFSDNYDFSVLNLNITNYNIDTTPPTLNVSSLKLDSIIKDFIPGDSVNISLKAYDYNSGIDSIYIDYKCQTTLQEMQVSLKYNESKKCYEGTLPINSSIENTTWDFNYVYLRDNASNSITYNNSDYNFPNMSFNVLEYDDNIIRPLNNITVINHHETLSDKTIEGDLYIGPNGKLDIKGNVTINGNIYVLGCLVSFGDLKCKTIYAKKFKWGIDNFVDNGTVLLEGINYINSREESKTPVTDIPIRIDNEPLIKHNGKINLKGATVDIADMYVNNVKVELGFGGTFNLKDLIVGNKRTIDVKFITIFGNTIYKTLYLNNEEEDLNADGYTDTIDLSLLANNYNKTRESDDWNSSFDLNKDGIIDIYDITRVSSKM